MTKIWYEDLAGFMDVDHYYVILPMSNMTFEDKLNALVRFFIYLGILLTILKGNYRYLFFGIAACIVSMILYEFQSKKNTKTEKFFEDKQLDIVNNKVCARSTVDNPFMNPTMYDIATQPDRPAACHVDSEKVQEDIERNFNARLFSDVSDLYGKQASQRQFYTMPSTTIPNDQTGFAEWLFGSGRTCKEGNGLQCNRNMYRWIGR
jgi:Family of unknown function (DUF5762)